MAITRENKYVLELKSATYYGVKARISDAAVNITKDAVQVVGGLGYSEEYPVERFYRDAKIGQISAGSAEIMRFLISREMIRMWGK